MKKLWEGRFKKETNKLLEKFNASILFDCRMYAEDINGSIIHSRMLAKQNIISVEEQKEIVATIEKLFTLCDELEGEINQNKTTVDNLMATVLKEAFEQ